MGESTPRLARRPAAARPDRRRIEVHMAPSLHSRVEQQARRLGLSVSAFVRLTLTRAVERGEQ